MLRATTLGSWRPELELAAGLTGWSIGTLRLPAHGIAVDLRSGSGSCLRDSRALEHHVADDHLEAHAAVHP